MNKCEKTIQLNLLLDGELSEAESQELQAHIEQCDACTQQWRDLQLTQSLWRQDAAPRMSAGALARIHQSIDLAMGRQVIEKVAYRLASLAALVAIAAGLWVIRPASTATTTANASTTITVPATWETVALKYTDDTTTSSADVGVATWMVADLSSMTSAQLR